MWNGIFMYRITFLPRLYIFHVYCDPDSTKIRALSIVLQSSVEFARVKSMRAPSIYKVLRFCFVLFFFCERVLFA